MLERISQPIAGRARRVLGGDSITLQYRENLQHRAILLDAAAVPHLRSEERENLRDRWLSFREPCSSIRLSGEFYN
jgi:hypothetical protein